MVDRAGVLDLYRELRAADGLIAHVVQVADAAVRIAERMAGAGLAVDVETVELGALLHDVGIPLLRGPIVRVPGFPETATLRSDDLEHQILGYRQALARGFPRAVALVVLRHAFGPSRAECERLGITPPPDELRPVAWEERAVAIADLLYWASRQGLNPWRDPQAGVRTFLPYATYFWQQATGQLMALDHPWVLAMKATLAAVLPYADPRWWGWEGAAEGGGER